MRRLLIASAAAFLFLAALLLVRAAIFPSHQLPAEALHPLELDRQSLAARLSGAVRLHTVAHQDPTHFSAAPFAALRVYLETHFPLVHQHLKREIVNDHSLLYTWEGTTDSLRPALLMAHLDVVPPGDEESWTHPPFSGRVDESHIWGRGTLDDKVGVLALMEAAEHLLGAGFRPGRTLYLAFGHDEEVGGLQGAAHIAALLKTRNAHLEFVLDEGGLIAHNLLPGLAAPVALVGIAEKGYLSVELSVETGGGHSSMPPSSTAIGVLAAAVRRLEEEPLPTRLDGATRLLFTWAGAEMAFARRIFFANLWLFSPLAKRLLAATPQTNALVRTTTAATLFEAGIKENVLPSTARAVFNFRLLSGDTTEEVFAHVKRAVDDPRVRVHPIRETAREPSAVSRTDAAAFHLIQRTVHQVFPDVLVAPWLMVAGTDSRHYAPLSDNVYRFLPVRLGPGDLARIHGADERIGVDNYAECVRFYIELLRNAD